MEQQGMPSGPDRLADANFVEIERQFIREKAYPNFEWVRHERASPVVPLRKPISESVVAMITTAGVHRKSDPAFDLGNRAGDPTYREIPRETSLDDISLSHVGYDTKAVSTDKNCVFPIDRLRDLETDGVFGALAPRHFSFMGYVATPERLVRETAPEVAAKLGHDEVDFVLLAPA